MTMSRKALLAAALAAGFTVGVATPVLAGEVNGRGDPTPVSRDGGFVAGSICAFSGLDDGSEGGIGGPGEPPQSWGQGVKSFAHDRAVGAAAQEGVLLAEGPGTNCRGFASGGE